jgi:hypothetical protein
VLVSSTTLVLAMMTTAKLSLSHRNMICAAIQGLPSRDTLSLINQNKDSIHDLNKAVTHESLNNSTVL